MNKTNISVVLPCLNEEKTILHCINNANNGIKESNLNGEVIVADNGSTDGSIKISTDASAKVVSVKDKGYGSALNGGIQSASGDYIIMGDSDSTYNFEDIPKFVEQLDKGYDLVIGNRFLGGIEKGAMPILNKFVGNPVLSFIAKKLFNSNIGDFHCGLRGFTKEAYKKMELRSSGMEFATEMIAKATLLNLKITEVPTTLSVSISPRTPHLKPFRDGLRHLNLMMTYSFIKLFNKSFNILLFFTIPLYFITLIFTPFSLGNIELSFGALNLLESVVLVTLILKSMLKINAKLFPNYIMKTRQEEPESNFGILFIILGVILYLLDIFYWGSYGFGQIDQNLNLKILSLASLCFIYGIFESFRIFVDFSLKYFIKK